MSNYLAQQMKTLLNVTSHAVELVTLSSTYNLIMEYSAFFSGAMSINYTVYKIKNAKQRKGIINHHACRGACLLHIPTYQCFPQEVTTNWVNASPDQASLGPPSGPYFGQWQRPMQGEIRMWRRSDHFVDYRPHLRPV